MRLVLGLGLVELRVFVLQEVVMDGGNVHALEHEGVANDLRSYKLLLEFRVLYEVFKLMFAKLGHSGLVEKRIFHLGVHLHILL